MRPGLGILIGLPVAVLFALTSVALIIIGRHVQSRDDYDREAGAILKWFGVGALVLTIGITAVAFWPYQKQYHYWQPVDGYVQEVSSRLLPAGDRAMEQKFVVRLVGDPPGLFYGIQDTRAALLKPGDPVSLSCIRSWQFGSGDHGFDCRWGAYR